MSRFRKLNLQHILNVYAVESKRIQYATPGVPNPIPPLLQITQSHSRIVSPPLSNGYTYMSAKQRTGKDPY